MEDITVTIENEDTTEVTLTEDTTVLVREYVGGENIEIKDNVINCTYKYQLPSSVVMDSNYVHTDNNFTTAEKEKLARLENTDLSGYYTQEQTDQAIAASHENFYTKQEIRIMINQDLESYYTREETDNAITNASTNAKSEVLNEVAKDYYNKTEVEDLISSSGGGGTGGGTGSNIAAEITISDVGNYFTSTNVEGALQELGSNLIGLQDAVAMQSEVVQ